MKEEPRRRLAPLSVSIITPVTRPENLEKIKESIEQIKVCKVEWVIVLSNQIESVKIADLPVSDWIRYEVCRTPSIAGNGERNQGLVEANGFFTYFLDDDNLLHPQLAMFLDDLSKIRAREGTMHYSEGAIFAQERGDGTTLIPKEQHIGYGTVDTAMCLFNTDIIKSLQGFYPNEYGADGHTIGRYYEFIRKLYPKGGLLITDTVMAYYNKLRLDYEGIRG